MSHNLVLIAPARQFALRQTPTHVTRTARNKPRNEVLLAYVRDVLSYSTAETVLYDIEHLAALKQFCEENPDFRWMST